MRFRLPATSLALVAALTTAFHAKVLFAQPTIIESDSLALVALYNATNGPGWNVSDNSFGGPWIEAGGEKRLASQWRGVVLDNLFVQSVSVSGWGLNGQMPDAINGLTAARVLAISNNPNLTGRIADGIGKITTLETLSLRNNGLSGTLPDSLRNLKNLTRLHLQGNQFTGPIFKNIERLTVLKELDLSVNQLSGNLPDALGMLAALGTLRLSFNDFDGPIPTSFKNLVELTLLDLQSNRLNGAIPAELGLLPKLRTLNLNANHLTGELPPELSNLGALESLQVRDNDLEGSIPDSYGTLSNLDFLDVSGNHLGGEIPSGFSQLSTLSTLYIQNNEFEGIPNISFLPELATVRLYGNKFTFEDLEPLAGLAGTANIFEYAPQQDVKGEYERTGGSVFVHSKVGGAQSECTWFRDGVEIEGVTALSYQLPDPDDTAEYRCEATNPALPELVLQSYPVDEGAGVTIVVNSEGDTPLRGDPESGVCDTGEEIDRDEIAEPECTLRAAIQTVNALAAGKASAAPGARILFDVPDRQIVLLEPATSLPGIIHQVDIDGTSQPGEGPVRIDGELAGEDGAGLSVESSNSTITGLTITGFGNVGIGVPLADGVAIRNCVLVNNGLGVIFTNSKGSSISASVVSGNLVGVYIHASDEIVVEHNAIGVEGDRITPLPNLDGVRLAYAERNVIRENVIAANLDHGILFGSADEDALVDNRVENNWIGTSYAAVPGGENAALGNRWGMFIRWAYSRTVVIGNTISNNGTGILEAADGVVIRDNLIGTSADGFYAEGNTDTGVWINGTSTVLENNTISGNGDQGVVIERGFSARIQGNRIGTDSEGIKAIPNGNYGMLLAGNSYTVSIRQNIISGNGQSGIFLPAGELPKTSGFEIVENLIGTDATGFIPIGNGGYGIEIQGSGVRSIARNLISANGEGGILIDNNSRTISVSKNFIGSDASGGLDEALLLPNRGPGIIINGSSTGSVTANLIQYNLGNGLRIVDSDNLSVSANYISLNQLAGIRGENADALAKMNSLVDNGSGTGIHWHSGHVDIVDNLIADDAGDGITLEQGSTATVHGNNISGNAGFGLNNLNPLEEVPAGGNWWGDASGPGGAGPGTGDPISGGIDFASWLSAPSSVVVETEPRTSLVSTGKSDSVAVLVNNFEDHGDTIHLVATDSEEWLVGAAAMDIHLESEAAGVAYLHFTPTAGVPDGTVSSFQIIATSLADASLADTTGFDLVAGASVLGELLIAPATAEIAPGDTVLFSALGVDQFGDVKDVFVTWTTLGGTVNQDGLYFSGPTAGIYTVTATVPGSGITGSATVYSGVPTAVADAADIPTEFALSQNYPNPFNPVTTIEYVLPEPAHVRLVVYDLLGRRVRVLADGFHRADRHAVRFDASRLPSGVYIYRLESASVRLSRKMLVLK